MSELADRLRELHAAKKPLGGIHGQMMGCEPYVLRASGNAFNWMIEAADRLDRYEELFRWTNENCAACGEGKPLPHAQPLPDPTSSDATGKQ